MLDIRTNYEKRKGWWIEERCMFPNALPKDGLIIVFRREDIEVLMDADYPHKTFNGQKVWYFNETRDREIAELDENNRICCNPQVLYRHFLCTEPRRV